MRNTPRQMTQKPRELASPRGSWPKGPERARDVIPAAKGRLMRKPSLDREGAEGGWDD